jgi:transposase-like protein
LCFFTLFNGAIMSRSQQTQQLALNLVALANIAYRRVRGGSWETVAAEFGWKPDELRNAVRHMPEYQQSLAEAEHELMKECEAELITLLRKQMCSEDKTIAIKATLAMAKLLADKQRDATRVKVEAIRSGIAHAKAEAGDRTKKNATPEREPQETVPAPTMAPAQVNANTHHIPNDKRDKHERTSRPTEQTGWVDNDAPPG